MPPVLSTGLMRQGWGRELCSGKRNVLGRTATPSSGRPQSMQSTNGKGPGYVSSLPSKHAIQDPLHGHSVAADSSSSEKVAAALPGAFVIAHRIGVVISIENQLELAKAHAFCLLCIAPCLLDLAHHARVHRLTRSPFFVHSTVVLLTGCSRRTRDQRRRASRGSS